MEWTQKHARGTEIQTDLFFGTSVKVKYQGHTFFKKLLKNWP